MEREWELRAACRTYDPDWWFSGAHRSAAKGICDGCPVQVACLESALAREDGLPKTERKGLVAGLTGAQRYALAQQRKPAEPKAAPKAPPKKSSRRWPVAPCGTRAAYQRHVRKREPIDDRCRAANNAGKRQHALTGSTQVR
ncbi:WhiB family transcriptional regulator [Streptomyces sp. NPDC059717]|uniref:WhiB family transcriptional regulator n=1 Tax=Streptomyces sp. NPDC059717 TaxID=3346922 RepID=UPI0036B9AC5E